ncbi:unnamed protein product [Arabidopsis halleri]
MYFAAIHSLARIKKQATGCTFHFDLPFFQKNSFLDKIQAHFVGKYIGFTQGGAAKEISDKYNQQQRREPNCRGYGEGSEVRIAWNETST